MEDKGRFVVATLTSEKGFESLCEVIKQANDKGVKICIYGEETDRCDLEITIMVREVGKE